MGSSYRSCGALPHLRRARLHALPALPNPRSKVSRAGPQEALGAPPGRGLSGSLTRPDPACRRKSKQQKALRQLQRSVWRTDVPLLNLSQVLLVDGRAARGFFPAMCVLLAFLIRSRAELAHDLTAAIAAVGYV